MLKLKYDGFCNKMAKRQNYDHRCIYQYHRTKNGLPLVTYLLVEKRTQKGAVVITVCSYDFLGVFYTMEIASAIHEKNIKLLVPKTNKPKIDLG